MKTIKIPGLIKGLIMLALSPALIFELSYAQITINKTDCTCKKDDGSATVTVNHGLPPYTYKWSTGATGTTINNLSKGTYTVSVTDKAGCKGLKSVTIKNKAGSLSVSVDGGGTVPFCVQDGPPSITITATVIGGTPPYIWFPAQSLTVSGSGTYSIGVSDDNSCTGRAKTVFTYVPIRCSRDPNEILGPEGFGAEKFVSSRNPLPYIINFENDPDFATAPAQRVEVRHSFDPHINMYSLRLTDFGFRGLIFNVPPNSSSYSTRLDVRDSLGIYVDVTAGIDVANSNAFWIFQSIDPATGFPPNDPNMGFLPVNDSITHYGEGYVSFNVKPRNNSQTGDSIKASAVIVFDINPPLATNTWFNTADAFPPVSHVDALPASVYDNIVEMTFTSNDDPGGSGVKLIHIYAAEQGQDYVKVGESHPDSSFIFTGNGCTVYNFFSIAEDNTGNTEAMKTLPEAQTTLNPVPLVLAQSNDTIINEGGNATINVVTMGAISYNWEYSTNGGFSFNPLVDSLPFQGAGSAILQIINAGTDLNGYRFRCNISNGTCYTMSEVVTLMIRASLSGLVRYENSVQSPLSNTEVFLIDTSGVKIDSVFSNLSGSYLFDILDPGTYFCGINIDKPWGGANAIDALRILRHFAELDTLRGLKYIAADVNASHSVNAVDALLIARRFISQISSFVTGDWYGESDTIEIGTNMINKSFKGICYGDADGSYIPGLKTEPSLKLLTSGEIKYKTENPIEIPFVSDRYLNMGALSVILDYPDDLMDIEDVLLPSVEATEDLIYSDNNGELRIAWYGLKPLSIEPNEPVFKLKVFMKNRPINQNISFILDGASEIGDSKANLETGLCLMIPKLINEDIPVGFSLSQNYPNPFKTLTEISYYLPDNAWVVLKVFNSLGEQISELVNHQELAGWHRVNFNGSSLSAGSYPVKLDIIDAKGQSSKFSIMTKIE